MYLYHKDVNMARTLSWRLEIFEIWAGRNFVQAAKKASMLKQMIEIIIHHHKKFHGAVLYHNLDYNDLVKRYIQSYPTSFYNGLNFVNA